MRTINVYKFEELSEEAKSAAIRKNRDINVEDDWWQCTYETMNECGIAVNSFDLYRRDINITIEDSERTAKYIVETFGEHSSLSKISKTFLDKLSEGPFEDDVLEDIEERFRRSISNEMYMWLHDEYEHLRGDEAIAETLEINEYEFLENGHEIQ